MTEPLSPEEEAALRHDLDSTGPHWVTRDWSEYCTRLLATLDATRAAVPDAGLREALVKFVTGEGAMATDPDGDCYFCEAEGVDFELPFHPGADPDYAGEHADWCLVPIARQWLAALPAPDPRP